MSQTLLESDSSVVVAAVDWGIDDAELLDRNDDSDELDADVDTPSLTAAGEAKLFTTSSETGRLVRTLNLTTLALFGVLTSRFTVFFTSSTDLPI